MNDDMVKQAAQQQAAVLEHAVSAQHVQSPGKALEQHAADQQAATTSCARDFKNDLDRHSDRLSESLKEADEPDVAIELAEQWRRDTHDGVSDAADQANRVIREVSQFAEKDLAERQQGFDQIDAAAQLAQDHAVAVDERSRTVCSSVERAVEEGATTDQLREILGEALDDLSRMKEEFDRALERIAGARAESPDSADMQSVADEVAKQGEQIREQAVRREAREIKLSDIKEQMKSGIYKSDLAMFIEDAGLDAAAHLGENGNLREVDAEIHHIRPLKAEPELGTNLENLEVLSRRAHTWGFHGGDFKAERNGQPADPDFDGHGFHMESEADVLGPEEDPDDLVENASEHQPYDFEDRLLEALDRKRDQERHEAQSTEEQRQEKLLDETRLNQEREERLREEERIANERDREEREQGRLDEERAAEERSRARHEEERRERDRLAEERARRQQEEARMAEERRKADEQNR